MQTKYGAQYLVEPDPRSAATQGPGVPVWTKRKRSRVFQMSDELTPPRANIELQILRGAAHGLPMSTLQRGDLRTDTPDWQQPRVGLWSPTDLKTERVVRQPFRDYSLS